MLRTWLAGTRIVDLGQYLPGPGAAQILADLGADVLKVEPPASDPLRVLDPVTGKGGDGVSPYYAAINAGKRVVRLDLKSADGKRIFERLIVAADVLIESFRPGALARLGLGPDRLRVLNGRLVHVALSGYGQTGSLAGAAGHDLNYLAFAGAFAASGPRSSPTIAFPPIADHASAAHAALCALGGLLGRARTGKGAFIDASLAETALAWQTWGLTAQAMGAAPAREGALLNGGAAYYRIYRTRDDKFVTLGAIEKKFWRNFCEAVDRPEWILRHAEPLPQTDLIAAVAALFAGKTRAEWDRVLGTIDCCYQAVLDYCEVADHPHVMARGLVRRAASDDIGPIETAFAAIVDGSPPPARTPYRDVTAEEALAGWSAKV
jgi:crotonobetainyl-CoA:carnitine CoA-transferase CaiB-like acyl-CoA transferase